LSSGGSFRKGQRLVPAQIQQAHRDRLSLHRRERRPQLGQQFRRRRRGFARQVELLQSIQPDAVRPIVIGGDDVLAAANVRQHRHHRAIERAGWFPGRLPRLLASGLRTVNFFGVARLRVLVRVDHHLPMKAVHDQFIVVGHLRRHVRDFGDRGNPQCLCQ
jgi:hypothetical protein